METGFNAGQTHSSIPIARKRLKIDGYAAMRLTPLHLTPPVGVIPLDDLRDFWWVSYRMARLQYGAKIFSKS